MYKGGALREGKEDMVIHWYRLCAWEKASSLVACSRDSGEKE